VKLDFEDGRVLDMPDEMPDESARQIKRWVLTLEDRARTAESTARMLTDEIAALRKQVEMLSAPRSDGQDSVVEALRQIAEGQVKGFASVVEAQLMDRILVRGMSGDAFKSKAARRGASETD
jgi:hypothetical protein